MSGVLILLIPLFVQTLHKLLLDKLERKRKEIDVYNKGNIWCQLDANLLGEIMGRLCVTDQARFRAVCNNWRASRPVTSTKSLPWYVCFNRLVPTVSRLLEFRFYGPSNVALVHTISLAKFGIPSPLTYQEIAVHTKHDWLFVNSSGTRSGWISRYFILFSLFTKEIITLPKLDYPQPFIFFKTFTTRPDSSDCVFFLLCTTDAHKIVVITYLNGDEVWTAREFDRGSEFLPCRCHAFYIRGFLYLVSPYGQIASYNIVDGHFMFESLLVDQLFAQNCESDWNCRVFELNGELMLLYFGPPNKNYTPSPGRQCIRMYDWSNKVWIPVGTLGDKSLFVSENFFEVAVINREEMSINGVIPNKIYRFIDCECLIFSIEDGELVEFKSTNSNLLEHGGGILPKCKYYCDSPLSDATKAIHWLDPPPLRY